MCVADGAVSRPRAWRAAPEASRPPRRAEAKARSGRRPRRRRRDGRSGPEFLRSIIAGIEARVVKFPIHPEPFGIVYPAFGGRRRTDGISRYNLYRPVAFSRDLRNVFCGFGQVLILAEDNGHVHMPAARQPHDVQPQAQIDAFLLRFVPRVDQSAGERNLVLPIPNRPAFDRYPRAAHREKPVRPISMPHFAVVETGRSRMETHSPVRPFPIRADRVEQFPRIEYLGGDVRTRPSHGGRDSAHRRRRPRARWEFRLPWNTPAGKVPPGGHLDPRPIRQVPRGQVRIATIRPGAPRCQPPPRD